MNDALTYSVRTRTTYPDPFAGLRGHDYIRARGLAPKHGAGGQQQGECTCAPCAQARLLPAVLRICAAYDRRKQQLPNHPGRRWNDMHDDSVLEALIATDEDA